MTNLHMQELTQQQQLNTITHLFWTFFYLFKFQIRFHLKYMLMLQTHTHPLSVETNNIYTCKVYIAVLFR